MTEQLGKDKLTNEQINNTPSGLPTVDFTLYLHGRSRSQIRPNGKQITADDSFCVNESLAESWTTLEGLRRLAVDRGWFWLTALLAAGFVARVISGPTLSPLGQLATRVIAPRIGHEKLVPGPPKRFAQAIGATLTIAALVLTATAVYSGVVVLLAMLIAAATLESVFGLCLGCKAFAVLMRAGVIPPETCEACANISLRAA